VIFAGTDAYEAANKIAKALNESRTMMEFIGKIGRSGLNRLYEMREWAEDAIKKRFSLFTCIIERDERGTVYVKVTKDMDVWLVYSWHLGPWLYSVEVSPRSVEEQEAWDRAFHFGGTISVRVS